MSHLTLRAVPRSKIQAPVRPGDGAKAQAASPSVGCSGGRPRLVDPAQAQFLAKNWLNDEDDQEDTNNSTTLLTDEERIARILELLAKVRLGSTE